MAKNIRQGGNNQPITRLGVICTDPASPVSGDPVRFGTIVGVADVNEDATTGKTTIETDCIAELAVKGVDGSGNVAVNAGDKIYYVDADAPKLSKKATGTPFGIAYGNALTDNGVEVLSGQLVASGATTTIRVLVKQGL